ncbi:type IV toxin-antitoxin system AbiEi family antitoxin domain-containing protein [Salinibacter altiplanensis]|uniref:type IV toxin-antitoxin system AbiEi family antitoxin domain-containing protein n=1 Tax=Salinibacter altiplanensis TaxID=1803181 RepID=UPI000C9EEFFF|nr:type IV toxin-antitoxin system AbiEi family antitoxin domain-containing protein [Salinibacter altiplanensis]
MQKNAAGSITEATSQGSETQLFPGKNPETPPKTPLSAEKPGLFAQISGDGAPYTGQKSAPSPRLSGEKPLKVPSAPHESEPGHTYRLARSLQKGSIHEEKGPSYEAFPADLTRVPVPDRVLDALDELTGCEVRLCLLMVRAAYSWVEDLGRFRSSSRWFTTGDIKEEAGGLGMSRESLRRAAGKLEKRGWIAQRKREGQPTAYRWRLKVPKGRYTPVPAPLLHAHQGLSHSALTLLLCTLRATWGWTTKEGGTVKYKRTTELSGPDLAKMTGLSRPTVRSVQEELEAKSALCVQRRHRGAAYEYAVDLSFFRHHLHKSYAPPTPQKNSNNNTRLRETGPEDAHAEGGSRGKGNAYQVTEEWEEQAIRVLSSEPIGMKPGSARHAVIRRAKPVVEGAIREFQRQKADIENPAGWMYSAIDEVWFGPTIPNKSPDVRQSSGRQPNGSAPIAQAFKALTEKHQGWEWDEDGDGSCEESSREGGTKNPEGKRGGLEQTVGVTHTEMCDFIEDLRQPSPDWETAQRQGRDPLFVPTKELANWAYFRRDSGSEQFQEAARRVVNLRARHEDRESPLPAD